MTLNHFVGLSLAGISNPLFHHRVVADRLDKNNLTAVFFITGTQKKAGTLTPVFFSTKM